MTFKIRTRRDIAAHWTAVNPILAEGEEALEMDTQQYKVGDGLTPWNDLPYWSSRPFVKTILGETYQLLVSDENGLLLCTNPLGCTVTLPNYADVPCPNGFLCHIHQDAADPGGTVELVAATGVTTRTAIGLKTRVQNSSLSVIVQAPNVFKIIGDAKA